MLRGTYHRPGFVAVPVLLIAAAVFAAGNGTLLALTVAAVASPSWAGLKPEPAVLSTPLSEY